MAGKFGLMLTAEQVLFLHAASRDWRENGPRHIVAKELKGVLEEFTKTVEFLDVGEMLKLRQRGFEKPKYKS